MYPKKTIAFVVAILIVGAALLYSFGTAQKQGEKLVLYNNFAYYEQGAKISGNEIPFELPYGIETDSITLRIVNGYVISQYVKEANYTTEDDLLKSYIGREISVFDENGKEIKGVLLKYDYGTAYVKTGNDLFIITPSYYQLPGFEGNASDENASVVFRINSTQQTDAKLSYLLDSISWKPDYTLYLSGSGGTLSLYGAITNDAKDYDNVSLSLFYGQVKRTGSGYYYPSYDYSRGIMAEKSAASAPDYTPSSISEFYKFDLGNVNLREGVSKFNLFEKQVSQIRKTYEMRISGYEENQALAIMLAMNNSEQNGLGIALPSGNVRIMDADGFVGEDYASETPKGEELEINTGNAFDVIGSSKLMNQSSDEAINCDPRVMQAEYAPLCIREKGYISVTTYEYEATVKNKKAESANIALTYSTYGEWAIMDETLPSEKISQNEIKWKFSIPANSEKTLKFTIRVKTSSYPPYYYTEDYYNNQSGAYSG